MSPVSSRRIRQETSLGVAQAKEAAAAANRQIAEASRQEKSVPDKINISSGGKGGTVIMITGVLFVGYLYFTRRLANVLHAIQMPGSAFGHTASMVGNPNLPGGGPPTNVPPADPVITVMIAYPDVYKLPPETVQVSARNCKSVIYQIALGRTRSPAVAYAMANIYCPQ